jgi:hypothetical protein
MGGHLDLMPNNFQLSNATVALYETITIKKLQLKSERQNEKKRKDAKKGGSQ